MRRRLLVPLALSATLVAAGSLAGMTAEPAFADSYIVQTTSDPAGACASAPCSLRQLIAQAEAKPFPPDVIIVPAGTYTVSASLGALVITGSLSIVGAGANSTTIEMPVPSDRASFGDRVFDIKPLAGSTTPVVTISGVTIR